jgi:hypothetical protein
MQDNHGETGGQGGSPVQEPSPSNPLKRLRLPAFLIVVLAPLVIRAIGSFSTDASRAGKNLRSLSKPPVFLTQPQPVPLPFNPMPQIPSPSMPHVPVFQPTVPVTLPRR